MLTAPVGGMPDPPVLTSMTEAMTNLSHALTSSGVSGAWPTAALAYFFPVRLTRARTYVRAFWLNGATAAGTVDVGVYTIAGTTATRIASCGPQTQAGVSALQIFTPTAFTIGPGLYYLAMSCSLGTATVWRSAGGSNAPFRPFCYQATSQSTLGATPTVASFGGTTIPVFGFSELASL